MKKRKIIGLVASVFLGTGSLLSGVMITNVLQENRVEAATTDFKDVTDATSWYYTPVYWAVNKGIVTGSNGYFYPSKNCTREQAITMLWRLAGKPNPQNSTSSFTDVKNKSSYSYKAILWGNEQGLILGSKGKFNPTGVCTREQIVTMLWRWAGKPNPKSTSTKFTDVSNNYAYKAIIWANENGIALGKNGKFSPKTNCKRCDIVTFIYRYDELSKKDKQSFLIKYHLDDNSSASKATTKVYYGESTKTFTTTSLGFSKEGCAFEGWKLYREKDDKWYVTDSNGKASWTKLTNGELPEGSSFCIYKDGQSVSKLAQSGTVHFYGQWIPSDVNVADYGANGKDKESDWQAIQKCLNYGKNNNEHLNVYVGEGTYYIDETLTVYSNTSLILDENAKIIRMDQSKQMLRGEIDLVTGGYGQSHDITIKGGEWDGNITDVNEKSYGLITFNHAQGITLEDFSIKGCSTRHMVTFDGVKDVVVRNVSFSDQIEYTGPDDDYAYHLEYKSDKTHNPDNSFKNMEALHIDYISDDGGSAGEAYPIDGTMNQNILVENCSFNNVFSGVGSHYNDDTGKKNENIIIRNNTFNNVQYIAIHVCQYNGAEVSGNTATDVGELLRINKSKEGKVINNTATIKNFLRGDVKNAPLYGMFVYSGTELTAVEGNTISGALYNGIHITEDAVVDSLKDNVLTNVGEYGIYVKNSRITNFISNSVDTVNNDGIQLMSSSVDLLKENTVKNSARRGIVFVESEATAIGNIIDTTEDNGVLVQSSTVTINNNEISNTKGHGISVIASTCDTINGNEINNVTGDLKDGILTGASTITEIKNNTITGTVRDGININSSSGTGSSVGEISGNNIANFGRKGIGIYNGSTVTTNENNNIQ